MIKHITKHTEIISDGYGKFFTRLIGSRRRSHIAVTKTRAVAKCRMLQDDVDAGLLIPRN